MSSALAGTLVVDFSHVMAGPYASHLLRLLGADVIKIEAPGIGDALRNYGADRRFTTTERTTLADRYGDLTQVLADRAYADAGTVTTTTDVAAGQAEFNSRVDAALAARRRRCRPAGNRAHRAACRGRPPRRC